MRRPVLHRVTATARPDGADLDVQPYLRSTLHDLIGLLAEKPTLMDDLCAIVDGPTVAPDPYRPDRPSRDEDLLDQLCAALPTRIRLHRPVARALGAALGRITRAQARRPLRAVPAQQDRRAS